MFYIESEDEDVEDIPISIISYSNLSSPGNLLTLLHEIGHSWRNKEEEDEQKELRIQLATAQKMAQEDGRTQAREDEILVSLLNEQGELVATPLPKELYTRYHKIIAKDERDAWAFALRTLRTLRKRGIDIEPALDTKEKIDGVVHTSSLRTYEDDLKKRVMLWEDYANMNNPYTRK